MLNRKFLIKHRITILLTVFYLASRLYHLTILPIFTDESIYIYWAKFIGTYHSQWFLPLFDGKPPLFVWLMMIFLKIFPPNAYLAAGRSASVVMGLLCVIGIFKLTDYLFDSKKTAIIAAFLYIFTPFTFFYDRMALFDTPLSAALVWSTLYTFKTADLPNLKNTYIWSILLGIAFYFKPTALFFWFILPFIFLIRSYKNIHDGILDKKKIFFSLFIFLILSQLINQSMRISSTYPAFITKNSQFQYPLNELIKSPFKQTINNFPVLISWLTGWLTWPLFIFFIISLIYLLIANPAIGLILSMLISIPLLGIATVGREIFPRYLLFITPYLTIAGSYLLTKILSAKNIYVKILMIIIIGGILYAPSVNIFTLYNDPPNSLIPVTDFEQYVSGHPSGYGVSEVINLIDKEIKINDQVTLVTEGTFGLYPYAFDLYYWQNPKIVILPRWPLKFDTEVTKYTAKGPVFVVLKDHESLPPKLPLYQIMVVNKPAGGKLPTILTKYKSLEN
jgi:4-amino-4-deoxy-L-arabinose transferase-like glycosyltransferase